MPPLGDARDRARRACARGNDGRFIRLRLFYSCRAFDITLWNFPLSWMKMPMCPSTTLFALLISGPVMVNPPECWHQWSTITSKYGSCAGIIVSPLSLGFTAERISLNSSNSFAPCFENPMAWAHLPQDVRLISWPCGRQTPRYWKCFVLRSDRIISRIDAFECSFKVISSSNTYPQGSFPRLICSTAFKRASLLENVCCLMVSPTYFGWIWITVNPNSSNIPFVSRYLVADLFVLITYAFLLCVLQLSLIVVILEQELKYMLVEKMMMNDVKKSGYFCFHFDISILSRSNFT